MAKYDERFVGFGWNKVSHVMELAAADFQFVVLHDAFIVHLPHTPSDAIQSYRKSSSYRRCLEALKAKFRDAIKEKYGKAP